MRRKSTPSSNLGSPWSQSHNEELVKEFYTKIVPVVIDRVNTGVFRFSRYNSYEARTEALFLAACNTKIFVVWKRVKAIELHRNEHAIHEQLRRLLGIQNS